MTECPNCQAQAAHIVKTTSKGEVVSSHCLRCGHTFEPVNPFKRIEPMLITDDYRAIIDWNYFYKGSYNPYGDR